MIRSIRTLTPALSIAAALAISACSDAPATAPQAPADLEASAAKLAAGGRQMVTVSINLRDYVSGAGVGSGMMKFNTGIGTTPITVGDNDALDLDKRQSFYKVSLPKGTVYEARYVAGIGMWDITEVPMKQVASTSNNVDMGTLYLRKNPLFTIEMRSATTNALLGGTQITLGWADGSWPFATQADNAQYDLDMSTGRIKLYGRGSRTHQVCEITKPLGYLLPSPNCQLIYASLDGKATKTFLHSVDTRVALP